MCTKNNPAIEKAVIKLEEFSEDERNFMNAERIEKDRRDRIAEVELGVEKGIELGIKLGIKQGIKQEIEQGIEHGIKQGIEQTNLQNATAMLRKKYPVAEILK